MYAKDFLHSLTFNNYLIETDKVSNVRLLLWRALVVYEYSALALIGYITQCELSLQTFLIYLFKEASSSLLMHFEYCSAYGKGLLRIQQSHFRYFSDWLPLLFR